MKDLKLDKVSLRKFGMIMGVAFGIISLLLLRKHNPSFSVFAVISVLFFLVGLIQPLFLKYIYIVWMKFAFILGWINTRILLFVVFFILITPISLIMKLFKVDLLNIRINRNSNSYWIKKPQKSFQPKEYENQF